MIRHLNEIHGVCVSLFNERISYNYKTSGAEHQLIIPGQFLSNSKIKLLAANGFEMDSTGKFYLLFMTSGKKLNENS